MSAFAKLLASVAKEFRVIVRDRPALALLFVMPLGFVTVMSLALQDVLSGSDSATRLRFSLAVLDGDGGEVGQAIAEELGRLDFLQIARLPADDLQQARARLRAQVQSGEQRLALVIPPGLTKRLDAVLARGNPRLLFNVPPSRKLPLDLLIDPALRTDYRLLVTTAIESAIQGVEIRRASEHFALTESQAPPARDSSAAGFRDGLMGLSSAAPQAALGKGATPLGALPTSTQQNVPAYSLLAIFMLVVPLSQTFTRERAQGSLTRLRSMPVPGWVIIGGKFLPYFVINLLQMALCLCVGRFLLPLLGAAPLHFEHALGGVVLLSAAASVAAIGFALLVAVFVRTVEQATAFGATAVLLLAALGGIMVPRMMMPPPLQQVALLSPLGWAQDGFLDLFVRGAGAADVAHRVAMLLAFGMCCLLLASWRFATLDHQR
jgi:ABC-2 type transport system permease protein